MLAPRFKKRDSMTRWCGRHWMWIVILATTAVFAPLTGRTEDEKTRLRELNTLTEIMGLLQAQSVEPPAPRQIASASIQGMLHTLDPHSNYMDENEFKTMRENQRGSFFGIGALIQQQPDGIVVVNPVRGGPSEKAGIRAGDYLREIDGKNTEGWTNEQAVQKLRGEKGTAIDLVIERPGYPDQLKFTLTRGEIPSNSVYYNFMLTPTTGFIHVKDFGETTSEEFAHAVSALKKQGMRELILDLRNNGGGLLDAALGICRQLLGPNELIVSQRGRDGKAKMEARTPGDSVLDPYPIVVLINRSSASASEIVTGAVQDHDRGLVVGQVSWGKGLVQTVLPIGRTRGLALTTARYYTPSGRCIQRDYKHGLDDYLMPDETAVGDQPSTGLVYKTDAARTVYGGGGITPDYKVQPETLSIFTSTLRLRHSAFFKFAVIEKDRHGITQGQPVDQTILERFKAWLMQEKIPVTDTEWNDPKNQADIRGQLSYEMQNIAFGVEAGFRTLCDQDPQLKKALEILPEAKALIERYEQLRKSLKDKAA